MMILRFSHFVGRASVCIINSLDSILFRRLRKTQWETPYYKWNNFFLSRKKNTDLVLMSTNGFNHHVFKHIQLLSEAIAKLFAWSLWWYIEWKTRNNRIIKWKSGVRFAKCHESYAHIKGAKENERIWKKRSII